MRSMQSWGRLSAGPHHVIPLVDPSRVAEAMQTHAPGIAYGNGRSYGDMCLNPGGVLWHTRGLDRLCSWNAETGMLVCESGVLLRDIQQTFVPKGWMLPVTPGTQFVTVGGAVANDVHGKNHHAMGSFGDQILRLWLARSDGQIIECTRGQASEWFFATIGGMGLTGVIVRVELKLRRISGPWLDTETIPYGSLDEFFGLSDASEAAWEHTVSWIDCLSGERTRGIFMRAKPSAATIGPLPKSGTRRMPVTPPVSLVNHMTLRPFNIAYHRLQRWKAGQAVAHYEPFFYPLDGLLEWNRMYGPKGFYQYQSVVPRAAGPDATREMLREIGRSGEGSFLAVLKTFGSRAGPGMLSFPRPGVTLALDFPNRRDSTLRLFSRLDEIVLAAGGTLYPAKDARMSRRMFESGYPRLAEFLPFRDPGITSSMSRRLLGS
ncbi:FAD-linked oxidase [Acidovorax sp. Root219]|nr:FAD-binding oxidoreductase [Acidovorax sp. Root219]KRC29184.1 FAD-linked oxidase [Acidovorax sp. Root219]